MARRERIVKFSAEELQAMATRGEDESDWKRAAAMTDEEVEAAVASDPDEAGLAFDWSQTSPRLPEPKAVVNMRVDRDVLDFFKREGRGYQTKINAVLRTYVDQMRRKANG